MTEQREDEYIKSLTPEQKIMYDKMDKLTSLAYPEYAQDVDNDSLTRMKPPFTELYMAHIGK